MRVKLWLVAHATKKPRKASGAALFNILVEYQGLDISHVYRIDTIVSSHNFQGDFIILSNLIDQTDDVHENFLVYFIIFDKTVPLTFIEKLYRTRLQKNGDVSNKIKSNY